MRKSPFDCHYPNCKNCDPLIPITPSEEGAMWPLSQMINALRISIGDACNDTVTSIAASNVKIDCAHQRGHTTDNERDAQIMAIVEQAMTSTPGGPLKIDA